MIEVISNPCFNPQTNPPGTIIRVCNYDKFQALVNNTNPQTNPGSNPPPTHLQPNPIEKKNKRNKVSLGAKAPKAKTNGVLSWENYKRNHEAKYGREPLRNAKVNSTLKRIGQALSVDDIPLIFDFYFAHQNQFYSTCNHSLEILERDLNKLMNEMNSCQSVDKSGNTPKRLISAKEIYE